jgi:hypothetical protein
VPRVEQEDHSDRGATREPLHVSETTPVIRVESISPSGSTRRYAVSSKPRFTARATCRLMSVDGRRDTLVSAGRGAQCSAVCGDVLYSFASAAIVSPAATRRAISRSHHRCSLRSHGDNRRLRPLAGAAGVGTHDAASEPHLAVPHREIFRTT